MGAATIREGIRTGKVASMRAVTTREMATIREAVVMREATMSEPATIREAVPTRGLTTEAATVGETVATMTKTMGRRPMPVNSPDKPVSVEETAIKSITKTIRKGLSELAELEKTSKELILTSSAGDPAIPDNCTDWLEGDDDSVEERLLRFENVHWEPLNTVLA